MEDLLKAVESLHTNLEVSESVWKATKEVITKTYVPEMKVGYERPLEKSDFKNFIPVFEKNLKGLKVFLSKLVQILKSTTPDTSKIVDKSLIVSLIVLCGEHKSEDLWTSTVTRKLSDELLNLLCEICKCTSSVELLVGQESNSDAKVGPLFKTCLTVLRPKLLKDTWKNYPAALACFKWMLLQVKVPYLSEHLSIVLPTALITVDDFNTETQVFGISCLEHIIEHVTRTELNWYGQGDVIYKALERLLYHREAELVRPLLRCVVLLLGKLEGGYASHDNNYKWSRYDDVLQIVLQNTEHEQNISLRRAYIDSLPVLLDASKMGVIRWSKRLLRILREYLEVAGYSEHNSAIPTLQVLKVYLQHSQPRIAHNSEALFQMLLRLLYDITKSSEGGGVQSQNIDSRVFQETVDLIEECLDVVVKNAPVQAHNIGSDIKTRALFNERFSTVINKVFV